MGAKKERFAVVALDGFSRLVDGGQVDDLVPPQQQLVMSLEAAHLRPGSGRRRRSGAPAEVQQTRFKLR